MSWFWQLCKPFFPLCKYLKLSYFKLPEETKKESQFFNLCLLCPFLSPELQRWCLFVCQFGQGWRRRRWWWRRSSQKVEDLVELRVSLSELLVFLFGKAPSQFLKIHGEFLEAGLQGYKLKRFESKQISQPPPYSCKSSGWEAKSIHEDWEGGSTWWDSWCNRAGMYSMVLRTSLQDAQAFFFSLLIFDCW